MALDKQGALKVIEWCAKEIEARAGDRDEMFDLGMRHAADIVRALKFYPMFNEPVKEPVEAAIEAEVTP